MNLLAELKNRNRFPKSIFDACINEAYDPFIKNEAHDPYIKNEIDFYKNFNDIFNNNMKEEASTKYTSKDISISTNTFYKIDVENENEINVQIHIPEMEELNKEKMELSYENNILKMRYVLTDNDKKSYLNIPKEIYFNLRVNEKGYIINTDSIKANFKNNILNIKLNKESNKNKILIKF